MVSRIPVDKAWTNAFALSNTNHMIRIFPHCTPLSGSKREMAMEYASVQVGLATLLCGRPLSTTADINSHTVAYWDGHEVRGFRLWRDDYCERLEQEFAFDERTCNHL